MRRVQRAKKGRAANGKFATGQDPASPSREERPSDAPNPSPHDAAKRAPSSSTMDDIDSLLHPRCYVDPCTEPPRRFANPLYDVTPDLRQDIPFSQSDRKGEIDEPAGGKASRGSLGGSLRRGSNEPYENPLYQDSSPGDTTSSLGEEERGERESADGRSSTGRVCGIAHADQIAARWTPVSGSNDSGALGDKKDDSALGIAGDEFKGQCQEGGCPSSFNHAINSPYGVDKLEGFEERLPCEGEAASLVGSYGGVDETPAARCADATGKSYAVNAAGVEPNGPAPSDGVSQALDFVPKQHNAGISNVAVQPGFRIGRTSDSSQRNARVDASDASLSDLCSTIPDCSATKPPTAPDTYLADKCGSEAQCSVKPMGAGPVHIPCDGRDKNYRFATSPLQARSQSFRVGYNKEMKVDSPEGELLSRAFERRRKHSDSPVPPKTCLQYGVPSLGSENHPYGSEYSSSKSHGDTFPSPLSMPGGFCVPGGRLEGPHIPRANAWIPVDHPSGLAMCSPRPRGRVSSDHHGLRPDLLPVAWDSRRRVYRTVYINRGPRRVSDRQPWSKSMLVGPSEYRPLEWEPPNYPRKLNFAAVLRDGDMGGRPFEPMRETFGVMGKHHTRNGNGAERSEVGRMRQCNKQPRMRNSGSLEPNSKSGQQIACRFDGEKNTQNVHMEPRATESWLERGNLKRRRTIGGAHKGKLTNPMQSRNSGVSVAAPAGEQMRDDVLMGGVLPKQFRKNRLPYTRQEVAALESSLMSWLKDIDLIKVTSTAMSVSGVSAFVSFRDMREDSIQAYSCTTS